MGQLLDGLLKLQSIERELAQVKRRLKTRQNAVSIQQRRIDQLQEEFDALNEKALGRRKDGDRYELDLRQSEEHVAKLRTALNGAKTNKEYAAILTQINTLKADNAKLEEGTLKILQEVDGVRTEADKVRMQIEVEAKRLAELQQTNAGEVEKLNGMMAVLTGKRTEAAKDLNREALTVFERVADSYDGEAMAAIQVEGKKPPFEYICGGCYMTLNAEHANALRVRDEIRKCDNCGRILYLEAAGASSDSQD
jgi:predicted  nucleic acid-binding Zn-ribbon protein